MSGDDARIFVRRENKYRWYVETRDMKRENVSALFRVVFRTYGRKSRFARRTIKTNTRALFIPRVFSFTLAWSFNTSRDPPSPGG